MHAPRSLLGLILILFALSTASLGASSVDADQTGSINVNGVTRTYVFHVPSTVGARAALLLSFHGHGGTGANQAKLSHLDAFADKYGFIVVYPDGINRGWSDGRSRNAGPDDIAFLNALIEQFSRTNAIDRKRISVTGFSNGATFAEYAACRLAGTIAAIAPVSGYLPAVDAQGCKPARPLSVMLIGGTSDPIMPYDGGQIHIAHQDRGEVLSAEQTISFWKVNANCSQSPKIASLPPVPPPDGTSVTHTVYQNCAQGRSVQLCTVTGGGHTWPGGPQYLPKAIIGKASTQLDASRVIADWILRQRLR